MKTGIAGALAGGMALAVLADPAVAGWENTAWGMTPAEIAAIVPGTRPPVDRDGRVLVSARHPFGGIEATVLFGFEAGRLASVAFLLAGVERCRAAEAIMLEAHGNPGRIEQKAEDLVTWQWLDPRQDNSIAFEKRPETDGQVKFCVVSYAPPGAEVSPGF